MDIDLETTADRFQLQDFIRKLTSEKTKNIRQELNCLKYFINTMKQQHQQEHSSKIPKKQKHQQNKKCQSNKMF